MYPFPLKFISLCKRTDRSGITERERSCLKCDVLIAVLLEENLDPLGQGTTGLISWQGAVMLSTWADAFGEEALGGKRVLELGSGEPSSVETI
jgi:hypothetical protein